MAKIADIIFKTNDLNPDKLYQKKRDSIRKLKELFTQNLNTGNFGTRKGNYYAEKGYYMEEVYFEDRHLAEVWEDKKVFVKWFLEKYPQHNTPYNPKRRYNKKKITQKGGSYYWVQPARIARERDLLFGLNGIEMVTVDNWREKIRDAKSKEEIEDIEGLLSGISELDEFVHWVKAYTTIFVDNMQDIRYEMKKPITPKVMGLQDEGKIYFNENFFKASVKRLEAKIENKPGGGINWGTQKSMNQLQHEAGLYRSFLVARELLEPALKKLLGEADEFAGRNGVNDYDEKRFPYWKPFPTPSSPKPTPVPTPVPDKPSPQSDPNDSGYESDLPDSATEEEAKNKVEEIKRKLKEASEKAKNLNPSTPAEPGKPDKPEENPQSPKPDKSKDKEAIKATIRQLEEEIKNKLEDKNNGVSSLIIDELRSQIANLKGQIEELKKSLKSFLEEAKDYAWKLFSYFQKENIKQITFKEDDTAKIEYENSETKTFSAAEIDQHRELSTLKGYAQQSGQNFLSKQELSQIVGLNTSPTSNSTAPKSHWEKYRYLYLGGAIVGLVVISGLIIYWLKKRNQSNQMK